MLGRSTMAHIKPYSPADYEHCIKRASNNAG